MGSSGQFPDASASSGHLFSQECSSSVRYRDQCLCAEHKILLLICELAISPDIRCSSQATGDSEDLTGACCALFRSSEKQGLALLSSLRNERLSAHLQRLAHRRGNHSMLLKPCLISRQRRIAKLHHRYERSVATSQLALW